MSAVTAAPAAQHLRRRHPAEVGGRGAAPLDHRPARGPFTPRALAAWAAVFGLYLQLAAAALCLAGSPPAGLGGPARPVAVAIETIELPGFAARPLSRRPTDAAPRGPPIAG